MLTDGRRSHWFTNSSSWTIRLRRAKSKKKIYFFFTFLNWQSKKGGYFLLEMGQKFGPIFDWRWGQNLAPREGRKCAVGAGKKKSPWIFIILRDESESLESGMLNIKNN